MIQLPPSEFTFAMCGWDHAPWESIRTTDAYIAWLLTQPIIGYCDSALLEIRPRPDNMAVMFDNDEYKGWVHIPKDVWENYMITIRKRDKK